MLAIFLQKFFRASSLQATYSGVGEYYFIPTLGNELTSAGWAHLHLAGELSSRRKSSSGWCLTNASTLEATFPHVKQVKSSRWLSIQPVQCFLGSLEKSFSGTLKRVSQASSEMSFRFSQKCPPGTPRGVSQAPLKERIRHPPKNSSNTLKGSLRYP